MVLPLVLDRHAEEAALLWLQRDRAVTAPHYTLRSVAELDDRVEAHLDGLRVAGAAGRARVWREFDEQGGPGEAFAAAAFAFESADPGEVADLFARVGGRTELVRPVISAVGWLTPQAAAVALPLLLAWDDPAALHVGIGGSAVRRERPTGGGLARGLRHPSANVRARALRAVGELGDRSLLGALAAGQSDADAGCRFWAAWSAALLAADPSAVAVLRAEVTGRHARAAVSLAARRGNPQITRAWLRGPVRQNDPWTATVAAGALGETDAVPWLIELAADPAFARPAGEAISTITGVDLTRTPFNSPQPAGHEAGPTDDPDDDDVALDPDADLPWPNAAELKKWWAARRGDFPAGTRLLIGRPIAREWLREVLARGGQRHRTAAAVELTALDPGRPLAETRAPGWRQKNVV